MGGPLYPYGGDLMSDPDAVAVAGCLIVLAGITVLVARILGAAL